MNYKELLFTAVGEQFAENHIKEVFFRYYTENGKSEVFATNEENKKAEIELTKSEVSKIRLLFLNKVEKQMKKEYPDKELISVIAKIDVPKKDFIVFVEFKNESLIQL